ncbi:PC-esterase domain-containing protein 1A isoform X2 [Pelodiscus sinensis]|uniref:PC-esterase domain-containing protein 1A isoform X2 n=1 Tax=Pelodiscus sinensis TaxID=13735 RepID=UPI003F6D669C
MGRGLWESPSLFSAPPQGCAGGGAAGAMATFLTREVQQLLHNKFVVIMGDSIQRSVYKDLVLLLQKDRLLSQAQLKAKGELSFENDCLVEGGVRGELTNGTHYKEVRQYRTDHHLVRFYFVTRIYSDYMESILADFQAGPQPDVLVINSCLWDVSRYGPLSMKQYRLNLEKAFNRLDKVLPHACLLVWNMTMPVGHRVVGGFLIPELQHRGQELRQDVIEGNFYGAVLASSHHFDVLDLHYQFRFAARHRSKDGIHWDQAAHRRISHLLLAHVADAWGVEVPEKGPRDGCFGANSLEWGSQATPRPGPQAAPLHPQGPAWDSSCLAWTPRPSACLPPPSDFRCPSKDPVFQEDSPFLPNQAGPGAPLSGYISFEDCPSFSMEGGCSTGPVFSDLCTTRSFLSVPTAATSMPCSSATFLALAWLPHALLQPGPRARGMRNKMERDGPVELSAT